MAAGSVESIHPRTGDLRRPGSAGYGAGTLQPLPPAESFGGVRRLDAEVAAAAARRDQQKQWKANFRQEKEAIQRRLASLGIQEAQRLPNFRAVERARRAAQRARFEGEKQAVQRRLDSIGISKSATNLVQAPATASRTAVEAQAGMQAAQAAVDAGRRARDEWEAAKRRVKKLEEELEQGRQSRVQASRNAPVTSQRHKSNEVAQATDAGSHVSSGAPLSATLGTKSSGKIAGPSTSPSLNEDFSANLAKEREKVTANPDVGATCAQQQVDTAEHAGAARHLAASTHGSCDDDTQNRLAERGHSRDQEQSRGPGSAPAPDSAVASERAGSTVNASDVTTLESEQGSRAAESTVPTDPVERLVVKFQKPNFSEKYCVLCSI